LKSDFNRLKHMEIKQIQIDNSLQPAGMYEGQTLVFGRVNYLLGKNGTGKTQVIQKIFAQAQSERARIISTEKGIVVKFLPAMRAHTVVGSKTLKDGDMNEVESTSMTTETFYQFLNSSPFTKTLVEHNLREFFGKETKIKIQGQNISFTLWDKIKRRIKKITGGVSEKIGGQEGKTVAVQAEIEVLEDELKELNLSNESDGMKEMLILLTFIYHPRVKIICIDEPETHLHPHMINFITDIIAEIAETNQKQFFIITHSPTAVKLMPDWKYFFFRREEEISESKISIFDKFNSPEYESLIRQLNPFKREAFYSDTIILLEGMNDYDLIVSLAKKDGYAEYNKGGISFLPCWGGHNLEQYYNFFLQCGKITYVIADNNVSTIAQLSPGFKQKFVTDPDHFVKLSKNDITEYCINTGSEKSEKIEKEIKIIESSSYAEANYTEILEAIRKVIGVKNKVKPNDEFKEMVHRMVNEFQMRFADKKEWQDVLISKDLTSLKSLLQEDFELNAYWQDSVPEQFLFKFDDPWSCKMLFRTGAHEFSVEFNKNSKPADIVPTNPTEFK